MKLRTRGAVAMQQIADWLEKLGLGQYAKRFADNDADVSVLPYLTDVDLEKNGVSLGHRRKILAAIAERSAAPFFFPRVLYAHCDNILSEQLDAYGYLEMVQRHQRLRLHPASGHPLSG